MNKKTMVLWGVLTLIAVYLLVLQILAVWAFTVDDMYIPLRYAHHWAEGQGLVWNINELPVEGYSNFLFVLLATGAIRLGLDPVWILKGAGVLGLYATTWGVYCLSRFWFSRRLSLIPCLWLLLYKGQIMWTASGLETTVYQALLCFSLYCLLRAIGYPLLPGSNLDLIQPSSYFMISGLLLALASLTRPEAPFLVGLFLLIACCDRLPDAVQNRAKWRGLLSTLGIFCLIYIPYFIWRWVYFGRLFPNPVYCKGLSESWFEQDANYLKMAWPFLLLALIAIWRAPRWMYAYFILPGLLYLLLLVAADPVSSFDNRLFLPGFALLLPLSFLGLKTLLAMAMNPEDDNFSLMLFAIAMLCLLLFVPMKNLMQYDYFTLMPTSGEQLRGRVLAWLNTNTRVGDSVVLSDSGLIPYKSRLRYLDSYCLNNRAMTEQPGKGMYERFCAQMMLQKPEVLILASFQDIYSPADVCLHGAVKNNPDYQLRASYAVGDNHDSYRYDIYQRKL